MPAEIGTLAPIGQAIAIFPNCKWSPSLERDETINLPAAHQSVHNPAHRVTESLPAPTLFLFLCEHALSEPGVVIHEQEVGIKVFGRSPDYDTSKDTLVRVHASRLRKKIQQYFLSDGQHEPIIIEIPKGGYTPVFQFRESLFSEIDQAPFPGDIA